MTLRINLGPGKVGFTIDQACKIKQYGRYDIQFKITDSKASIGLNG